MCSGSISSMLSGRLTSIAATTLAPARRIDLVVGAVGGGGVEQVAVFGPHPLGVAVGDRREEQEARRGQREPLLVDAALAQQHGLPAVEQRHVPPRSTP